MSGKKGMINRNKQFLLNRLHDMYGDDFEPVIRMAENAVFIQRQADEAQESTADEAIALTKEAITAWDKIARYVTPQLKATEYSFPEPIQVENVDTLDIAKRVAFLLTQAMQESG